ncbi:MAG: ATP-binding protein [Bacteroidales bacterium]|jgi:nicotinamide riboside kinase|nr:ATP-binding protein [Bacteroidales bacterium]MCK9577756.1 ATP-binding protein [Clostridia bacterium]
MRIAICGASSAGKTTLVKRLAMKHPEWTIIQEVSSNFDRQYRNTVRIQRMILEKQIDAEINIKGHTVLLDRCVLDNLVYCWRVCHTIAFDDCLCLINNHMRTKPYDLIVFVNEYFPLVDNGLRDIDPVAQRQTFSAMSIMIPAMCNAYGIPFLRVTGHTNSRIDVIEKRLRELRAFDP